MKKLTIEDARKSHVEIPDKELEIMLKILNEQIEAAEKRDPDEKIEVSYKTLVCLLRHVEASRDVDCFPQSWCVTACTFCPLLYVGNTCRPGEWHENMKPAIESTGIRVRIGRKNYLRQASDRGNS
ncbi:hypothetical protein [Acetobacterium wieringae]|uniref:hypothetical protein n=1 Tax=Acetobacterium wieringae TaxID=52694 RepID=UPI002033F84B|nr:hypothetical protein [Acetobacterium wieringae]URN84009.1 hypothetical protein CHL1_003177 [Acetobacterium wieringae]